MGHPLFADKEVTLDTGIVRARRALNNLHFRLAAQGFSEVYVDQMDYDVVAVTRHKPGTHEKYVLVAHTVFNKATNPDTPRGVRHVQVEGKLDEVTFEARMVKRGEAKFSKNDAYINGLTNFGLQMLVRKET
jgi:glycogen debranching enzyme